MNNIQELSNFQRSDQADSPCAVFEGSKLKSTYFEFRVTFPSITFVHATELSDSELLIAADKAGTFDFLESPEEDIYNDLVKLRE